MNHVPLTPPRLHVGAGTTYGALTVFPLWVEGPSVLGLHWSGHQLAVSELDGPPSVDEIVVNNRSTAPAVLLEGDLVEGGWRNRMIAGSSLLAPASTSTVSARCVEQGRWGGDRTHQANRKRAAYSVYAAHRDPSHLVDQGHVWRRIDRFEQELGRTASASLVDHLNNRPAPTLSLLEGQRGMIIGIGGRVVAAEIFGRSRGFVTRWEGIIGAAWLDSLRAPAIATRAEEARAFVRARSRRSGCTSPLASTSAGGSSPIPGRRRSRAWPPQRTPWCTSPPSTSHIRTSWPPEAGLPHCKETR